MNLLGESIAANNVIMMLWCRV